VAPTTPDLLVRVQAALSASYIIERELSGGGAMSRVFVGVETALDRRVVVKVLVADQSTGRDTPGFLREAVIAARLSHPNIVPVFAVGTVAGMPYYTMPFIEGESLRDHLDRVGAMSATATTRLLREIGSALAAAHALGIVHREVTPDNIVLERGTGRALRGDCGIAAGPGQSTTVASDGTTVGTPLYMSPEQVDGVKLDGRTDIYSLGLVAWEMLVGRRPWKGETLYDVMYCQKHDPLPSLADCAIGVPASLARAIEGALEKDRGDRWPSAQDLLAALDGRSPSGSPPDTPASASTSPEILETVWSAERESFVPTPVAAVATPDPALVSTVAMPVRQDARWVADTTVEEDRWVSPHRTRVGSAITEPVTHPVRWVLSACGAILVMVAVVTAATSDHRIVRWALSGGDVDSARSIPAAVASHGVARVSASDAAAHLAAVPPLPPVLGAHDTVRAAPLAQVAAAHRTRTAQAPTARPPRTGLSATDAARARAATARLSLEAYERVMADQRAMDAAQRASNPPR
jgi:serine/threonine protein kinase